MSHNKKLNVLNGDIEMDTTTATTTEMTAAENRTETRSDLAWPVSIWLPEAGRFFNGKSVNISKGGVFLSVPMTTPVRVGHDVEINFPRTPSLAKQKGQYARIKHGKIVRVDRRSMFENGNIGLAIAFTAGSAPK
jgi:hypothetical protein